MKWHLLSHLLHRPYQKMTELVIGASRLLWPIVTRIVKRWPPVAVLNMTGAKEEVQ